MIRKILLSLLFILMIGNLYSELIIKQAKDGRIVVTNRPDVIFTKSRVKASFITSSPAMDVPFIYKKKVGELALKYGLSEKLILAVIKAESDFNVYAKSKKGAAGLMQLMKDTAIKYGVSNRYDAQQNLEAGIKHLKYLYEKYNGDLNLTVAAYNAGEGAVKKYNGVPPYKETKNYIKRVRKFMGLSYSTNYVSKVKTKIFKYFTSDGRIVVSDTPPVNAVRKVEIFD